MCNSKFKIQNWLILYLTSSYIENLYITSYPGGEADDGYLPLVFYDTFMITFLTQVALCVAVIPKNLPLLQSLSLKCCSLLE